MAINVAYKVPAALLQAERDRERRAFNRQLQLQQNQQNFQREMQDAAYARSLENRQFNTDRQDALQKAAWDRQDALREDERQYRADLLKDQYRRQDYLRADEREYQEGQRKQLWDRQDALRREQIDLDIAKQQYAEQQKQAQMADALRMQEWQKSMVERQQLERNFTYSPEQQADLDRVHRDMRELISAKNTLTPDQFQQALWNLRAQEATIMPDTPIVRETPEEQFNKNSFIKKINGQDVIFYPDGKGGYKVEYGSQDAVKTYMAAIEYATKGATDKETGLVDEEKWDRLYNIFISHSPQEIAKREKAQAEESAKRNKEKRHAINSYINAVKEGRQQIEEERANEAQTGAGWAEIESSMLEQGKNSRQEFSQQDGSPTKQNMRYYDSLKNGSVKNGTLKHNRNFDRR